MVVGSLKKGLKGAMPALLLFFILFITLSVFSSTHSISNNSTNIIYSLLEKSCTNSILITFINVFTLVVGAFLISLYTIKQEIADKQNYIAAFIYLFLGSITLNTSLIHPSLIANIFILLALISMSNTYREQYNLSQIFNSGLFISLGIFFYINYSFFVFIFFIAMLILRPFNWREWVIGIFGLLAPIFIYSCVGYLANFNYTDFFSHLSGLFYYFQKPIISEYFYPLLAFLVLLTLLGIAKHLKKGLGSKIKTQKNFALIYWLLFLSLINFISKNNNAYYPLVASTIPLSILLADYFYNIKTLKVANTLFFILLVVGLFIKVMSLRPL